MPTPPIPVNTMFKALVDLDLFTPESAKAYMESIKRQDGSPGGSQPRSLAEQEVITLFSAALTNQRDRLLTYVRAHGGVLPIALQDRVWTRENQMMWDNLKDGLLDVASQSAVLTAVNSSIPNLWSEVNQEMIDWTRNYYTSSRQQDQGSIPNLNQTSRQRVADALDAWVRHGLVDQDKARGLPDLINALNPIFGPARAQTIGATETTRIFTESLLKTEDHNPFTTTWQWRTAFDDYVCTMCGPRNNTMVKKGSDGFPGPEDNIVGYPPIHPRCRCGIVALSEGSAGLLQ
jgi:hypothetical protein